ncbi:2-oxoacid:acceptor oxidoreductase subunit alpha [Nitrospira sp.]
MQTATDEIGIGIVGSGGAGVMMLGNLLLGTATRCGLYGLMTKQYGPQIRGGESLCVLRLGISPFEKQPDRVDILAGLDWRNASRFQEFLLVNPEGWVFCEQSEKPVMTGLANVKHCVAVPWKAHIQAIEGGNPNIFLFGLLASLLELDSTACHLTLEERFREKGTMVVDANQKAFEVGWAWNDQHHMRWPLVKPTDPVSRWQLTGNQAIVLGSLVAGCDFFAGYPITPATDIMEELSRYFPQQEKIMVQAEDELAAITMAIGASFGGKKAMTATSGPGFSLMAEGLGLALMTEIPLVVINVQRTGPSTGIATTTEQADLWAALASSHGDNPRVVLAPDSVLDCLTMTVKAFNIAEEFQVPVILLSDQFLGARSEIIEPIPLEQLPVCSRQLKGNLESSPFYRFESFNGAIAPMTIPGMPGGEFSVTGSEHDVQGRPDASFQNHRSQSIRRLKKLDPLKTQKGWIESCGAPDATAAFIAWGSTGGVVREAVNIAQSAGQSVRGVILHLLFPPQVDLMNECLASMKVLYVVELSSMKQFYHYLHAFYRLPNKVIPIARAGGVPFRTEELLSVFRAKPEL